jgi:hypothetical protein
LLALADQEEAKRAEDAILSIMTACGFHELVGQRVTKITKSLDRVLANRMKKERVQSSARQRRRARAIRNWSSKAQASVKRAKPASTPCSEKN